MRSLGRPSSSWFWVSSPLFISNTPNKMSQPDEEKKHIYQYISYNYIYIIVLSLNLGFAWGLNNLTWGMFHYFTIHSWESTRIDVSFPGASDANYHLWMRSLGIFRIRSFSLLCDQRAAVFQLVPLVGWWKDTPDQSRFFSHKSCEIIILGHFRYFKWFLSGQKMFHLPLGWGQLACVSAKSWDSQWCWLKGPHEP